MPIIFLYLFFGITKHIHYSINTLTITMNMDKFYYITLSSCDTVSNNLDCLRNTQNLRWLG